MRIKKEEQKEEQKENKKEEKNTGKKMVPESCRLIRFGAQSEKLKEIIDTKIAEYLKTKPMHKARAKFFKETINDLFLQALSDSQITQEMLNELIREYKFIRNTDSKNYCRALANALATHYNAPKSVIENYLEFREQWRSYHLVEKVEAPTPPECDDPLDFYMAPREVPTKCSHLHFIPVPRPSNSKCLIM